MAPGTAGTPPTAVDGLRGTIEVTNVNTMPINFLLPVSDAALPLGDVFTLNEAGQLLSAEDDVAGLSSALGDDPLQVSFPTKIISTPEQRTRKRGMLPGIQLPDTPEIELPEPLTPPALLDLQCSIQPDEATQTCALVCVGGPVDDSDPTTPEGDPFSTQLVCGADNSYNVGSFEDGEQNTGTSGTNDAACATFTPLVVEVESIIPGGEEGIEILSGK